MASGGAVPYVITALLLIGGLIRPSFFLLGLVAAGLLAAVAAIKFVAFGVASVTTACPDWMLRPTAAHASLEGALAPYPRRFGFPSGHTAWLAAFGVVVLWWCSSLSGFPLALLAACVLWMAAARVRSGHHTWLQVAAGSVVGVCLGAATAAGLHGATVLSVTRSKAAC